MTYLGHKSFNTNRADKVIQWVKRHKLDDLSLIPGTHKTHGCHPPIFIHTATWGAHTLTHKKFLMWGWGASIQKWNRKYP